MKAIIKAAAIYILRVLMRLFRVFPIKKNRIIFNAYKGSQYACNPRFIYEYLRDNHQGEFEIIWAFKNPEKYSFLEAEGVKVIKYGSLQRLYYEATAKISINNVGSFSWLPLREGQQHVNTWHSGIDLECCGVNEPANSELMRHTIAMSGWETSLFLSSNKLFSDYSMKVQFDYRGAVLNAGLPRSDKLLSKEKDAYRARVRDFYGVSDETVVVMYAPTWRYGGPDAMPVMVHEDLYKAACERFGDNVSIWSRSHHLTRISGVVERDWLIDASEYPDIEELILGCDVLISDYSSVLWDGAVAGKMMIQYAPDADSFSVERGLYVPVGSWCVPVSYSMEELGNVIRQIDEEKLRGASERLLSAAGNYETGSAAEVCCAWIRDVCNNSKDNASVYLQYLEDSQGPADEALVLDFRTHGKY